MSNPVCVAQDTVYLKPDGFMEYLKRYHPVIQKYRLLGEQGRVQLVQSKGQFDPALKATYDQKDFDGKNYYNELSGQLKVPTWYGPDFKLGYDNNSGYYLNPEHQTPGSGLMGAGISVPLAQGLIINDRLVVLKQARIFVKMAEAEQTAYINKFLLSALKQYWEWYVSYNKLQVYIEGYSFADQRYRFIVQRMLQGDAAPIDTVEASIQMQNMLMNRTNAEVEYYNATMQLNNYLWKDEVTPLELPPNIVPALADMKAPTILTDTLQRVLQWASENNPGLRKLNFKIDQLDVERRFAQNKLLPKVNLDYTFLSEYGRFTDGKSGFNASNTKLGGSFAIPVFLRAERGKLKQTRLKLLDAGYDLQQGRKELESGLKALANECNGLWRQIGIQENVVKNSERLRNAEKINFDNGEGSLFLINTREIALLNNQLKYYEMVGKYEKSKASFYNLAGNLGDLYGIR
ncbi:MAG: TolC family protein [Sediminibacterium sp.]|nr:TolC family protein [Sediminibacterium sp.]